MCLEALIGLVLGILNLALLGVGSVSIWLGYMMRYEAVELFTKVLPRVTAGLEFFGIIQDGHNVVVELKPIMDERLGIGFMVFGALLVVISIFGVIAGCCRVDAFITPYAIVLFFVFVGTVIVTILFATRTDVVREAVGQVEMRLLVDEYEIIRDSSKATGYTPLWDKAQQELKCCGVKNFTDFVGVRGYSTILKVPSSCCRPEMNCSSNPTQENSYVNQPCEEIIWQIVMNQYQKVLIIMCIINAVIFTPFLMAVILKCCNRSMARK